MIRTAFFIAALTAAAGCSAAALQNDAVETAPAFASEASEHHLVADTYQPYLTCDVVATRTRNGVRIEAIAHAGEDVSDTIGYDLTVTKGSSAGSSDIVQSGEVDLIGGQTVTLGTAEFNLERRANYDAELVLTDDGEVICHAELQS